MDLLTIGILICAVLIAILSFLKSQKDSDETIRNKDEIIKSFRDLTTGGDSFIYVSALNSNGSNEVSFLVNFVGKNPMYDVTIKVTESDIDYSNPNQISYLVKKSRDFNLGTVNPIGTGILFTDTISNNHLNKFGRKYFVKINSRNGLIEEDVQIRFTNQDFKTAHKVNVYEPNYSTDLFTPTYGITKQKLRHIDPGFMVSELDFLDTTPGWKSKYEIETGQLLR